MITENQIDNQIEYQIDNQIEKNIDNQIDKNVSCSIFLEQINLINQLPIEERGNVLYLAILNSFRNFLKNQIDNQIDNQIENTYISISTSISLSLLSKSVLELMNKTLNCRIYSSNYGGKRKGAGRPKKDEPIPDNQRLYGEYNNVCLTDEQHSKLLGICASSKLLDEIINDLSKNIGRGKVEPYSAKYPDAHFIQLKAYYDYRRKYPEKFRDIKQNNTAFDEFYKREKAKLLAKGYH